MNRGIEASFESDLIDELRMEAEKLHQEIEERKEMAAMARIREKAAEVIAFCFAASAVLMIGTYDGTDKLFVITLIVFLIMSSITAHFCALAFREEANELGDGRELWEGR